MFVFSVAAIAEIAVGFFVYQLLDPEKAEKRNWFLKWNWINFEETFLDFEKDLNIIKQANKIALIFCFIIAGLTLVNGILVIMSNFIDFKEILLIGTMIIILPLRYFFIFMKKMIRKRAK